MASKLSKLLLPAYDFKFNKARYYHYAMAVYEMNVTSREAMNREAVDKGWIKAVETNYPNDKACQERLLRQRFSRGAIAFWKGFERDEPVADYFQGTRTWGTYMINGTKVALPAYDRSLWEMDYVQFASVLLPRVNPGLDITRDIADHAWAATIARAPAFKNARRRQQEAVLAETKSKAAKEYWKKHSAETDS